MSGRKTVLFFGEAISLAHVTRPLVLARSLDPLQYDVHFACDDRYLHLVGSAPHIQIHPIDSVASTAFLGAANRLDFGLSDDDLNRFLSTG